MGSYLALRRSCTVCSKQLNHKTHSAVGAACEIVEMDIYQVFSRITGRIYEAQSSAVIDILQTGRSEGAEIKIQIP